MPPPKTPEFATATEYPVKPCASPSTSTSQSRGASAASARRVAYDVDSAAEREPRGVGDDLDVGVDPGRGDAEERRAARVRDVDRGLAAVREQRARARRGPSRCRACARSRCRARPAARRARRRSRAARPRSRRAGRRRPSRPRPRRAPSVSRASSRAWASEYVRSDRNASAARAQRRLDAREQPRGAAAAGAGVDDEAERAPGHARAATLEDQRRTSARERLGHVGRPRVGGRRPPRGASRRTARARCPSRRGARRRRRCRAGRPTAR